MRSFFSPALIKASLSICAMATPKRERDDENPRKLYGYWRSSASWRIRIALHWKGLAYEYKAVNLLKGEDSSPEYMALNPNGIPTLVDGDTVVPQSLAALEYLDEVYPERPLLPKDPAARARVRATALIIVSLVHPLQNNVVLSKIESLGGSEEKARWIKDVMTEGFASVEQQIRSTAGKYSFGDQVTILDACLIPQVYNARRFAVDLTPFPTVLRVVEELEKLPAFTSCLCSPAWGGVYRPQRRR